MLLKNFKRSSLQVCKNLGLFRMVRESGWRRRRLLILGYHGVSLEDEHDWDASLYMSPEDFASRLEILKRENYAVLPLREAVERLYRNDLPERSVSLTFDDGYYDFYKQAYPLIRDYDFPVTVYLTTFHCYFNKPIFGLVCPYLLWKKRGQVVQAPRVMGENVELDLTTARGRLDAMKTIWNYSDGQHLSAEEKNEFARSLAEHLELDYEEILEKRLLHLMKPEEVAELSAESVDFQMHTHRHHAPVNEALFYREIDENRASIEEMTGERAAHFCYPSGVHRPQYLPWLKTEKVSSATTCEPAFASAETDALLLPRLVDHCGLAPIEFESWLTGFASFVPSKTEQNHAS
jgi:peptidoglycan/xylan/chitin deacetylase (PgdA/CDA1 family)